MHFGVVLDNNFQRTYATTLAGDGATNPVTHINHSCVHDLLIAVPRKQPDRMPPES